MTLLWPDWVNSSASPVKKLRVASLQIEQLLAWKSTYSKNLEDGSILKLIFVYKKLKFPLCTYVDFHAKNVKDF